MNKDSQMRAAINQKLIEMGERERLKELLRAKLVECGWRDQLKAHCKGTISWDFPYTTICRVLLMERKTKNTQ
uniref:ENY2 transcription and export complex 2 subunit n=1 Tax=Echeneis naucrates TaxID=173247 RepID=A0A665TTA0_ECHNA